MDFLDRAVHVREGKDLERSRLADFLKKEIPHLSGTLAIHQFPSGFSNLTYLVTVGSTELVLRRPPFGTKAKSAHDMFREFRILKALKPVYHYCPDPLAYSDDESIIGSPFFVMERLKGIILRKDLPAGLTFSPGQAARLCESLVDVQLELHSLDFKKIGLDGFGRPEGYSVRQVKGWAQRYESARTPDAPDFIEVISWLKENLPEEKKNPSVIHNDFKLDNVVLDPHDPLRIIGILDWEMATVGDPLLDLGNSMAYWVEKTDPPEMDIVRLMPTNLDGALTRQQMVARYLEKSGIAMKSFDFYYCFGLFRLAVIAQQIYYRFYHGQTTDERFRHLILGVKVLENAALRVLRETRL